MAPLLPPAALGTLAASPSGAEPSLVDASPEISSRPRGEPNDVKPGEIDPPSRSTTSTLSLPSDRSADCTHSLDVESTHTSLPAFTTAAQRSMPRLSSVGTTCSTPAVTFARTNTLLTFAKTTVCVTEDFGSSGGRPSYSSAAFASSSKLGTLGTCWNALGLASVYGADSCGMPSIQTC